MNGRRLCKIALAFVAGAAMIAAVLRWLPVVAGVVMAAAAVACTAAAFMVRVASTMTAFIITVFTTVTRHSW